MPAPVFFERLPCDSRQLAGACPGTRRVQGSSFDQGVKRLDQTADLFGERVNTRPVHHEGKKSKCHTFPEPRFIARSVSTILQQVMVEIDFDGAGFRAGSAKRTGKR